MYVQAGTYMSCFTTPTIPHKHIQHTTYNIQHTAKRAYSRRHTAYTGHLQNLQTYKLTDLQGNLQGGPVGTTTARFAGVTPEPDRLIDRFSAFIFLLDKSPPVTKSLESLPVLSLFLLPFPLSRLSSFFPTSLLSLLSRTYSFLFTCRCWLQPEEKH